MREQRILRVNIDERHGDRARDQILVAAGDGDWRIVSLLSLSEEQRAARASPGNTPDEYSRGLLVLVLVERETEA
jgi:hypothetical protein